MYFSICSFKCAAEWLVTFFLAMLAASLPTVEDTQASTLLSADDNWLLFAVGVVPADNLSGKLVQVRKNGFRSTILKPKSSSQENSLWHSIAPTILYHTSNCSVTREKK